MSVETMTNLSGQEAIDKIKELTGAARTCLMITSLDKRPLSIRPMTVQTVDEHGRLYFFCHKQTKVYDDLKESGDMQLTCSSDKNSEYLSLYGNAEVYRDQSQIDKMYTQFANNWFDGKEDPNLYIIRLSPETGHYWDTKHGKFVQLMGILVGAVLGKPLDDGIQGDINI